MVDLEYQPGTLLPAFPPERIRGLESWWGEYIERRVRLPQSFIEHAAAYHGGVPGKRCFRTTAGTLRKIGRFFNLAEEGDLVDAGTPSWRQSWGSDRDLRLDYQIRRFHEDEWYAQRLQEHDESLELLPIAGLLHPAPEGMSVDPTLDGLDDFDLLCLDYYTRKKDPRVVVWRFAGVWTEPPVIEPVAANFAALLDLLHRC